MIHSPMNQQHNNNQRHYKHLIKLYQRTRLRVSSIKSMTHQPMALALESHKSAQLSYRWVSILCDFAICHSPNFCLNSSLSLTRVGIKGKPTTYNYFQHTTVHYWPPSNSSMTHLTFKIFFFFSLTYFRDAKRSLNVKQRNSSDAKLNF